MNNHPVIIVLCMMLNMYINAGSIESNGYHKTLPAIPFNFEDERGNYNFGYSVNNINNGDVKVHQEMRNNNQLRGYYAILDPDGQKRIVIYTVDENGYRAYVRRGSHIDYQFPVETKQQFYTGARQGLHTSVLDRDRYRGNLNKFSAEQEFEFQKLLNTLGQGQSTNSVQNQLVQGIVPYVKPHTTKFAPTTNQWQYPSVQPALNQNQHQVHIPPCSFRTQPNYPLRRMDSDIKSTSVSINKANSVDEPYYNIDIRRAAPASLYSRKL